MMRPARTPAALDGLVVADEHLARALRGEDVLVFDGAMGTELLSRGLAEPGDALALLSIDDPVGVAAVHAAYAAAGAEVATTNTFVASERALRGCATVSEAYRAAVACARRGGARYVAGDIGPIGARFELGEDYAFQDAYDRYAPQVDAVRASGCDLVLIETMVDLREAAIALRAARERCDLPVLVTLTLDERGRTYLGAAPEMAAAALESLGAHAVGFNCSFGPDLLLEPVRATAKRVRCPVLVQPNAGLPRPDGDRVAYGDDPASFAEAVERLRAAGASMVGGCCGTTPAHIERLCARIARSAAKTG